MSIKINEITICLHCGCNKEIVDSQIKALEPLSSEYKVYWNNRIDRYPHAYPSYSRLINHSVATSPTEFVILINDRTFPTADEAKKMINQLENGFACSFLYNVGFMGFSKQLVRRIGWWDERYLNGGWEDFEWVYKLKMHNLALYESCDSTYSYDWKSPLQKADACALSGPHWQKKWQENYDKIIQVIPDESYPEWDESLKNFDSSVEKTWKTWNDSILNVNYIGLGKGQAPSCRINNRPIVKGF